MTFPSPIGGVPYSVDFAPSIVFAVAYACLLPLVAYRILDKNSRTTILIGSCIFAVGRIATFSLRATQARDESRRFSLSLTAFIQSDLALGYIGIASDLVRLLRTLLIVPTYGTDTYVQSTEAESRYRYWISAAKLTGAEGSWDHRAGQRRFPGKPPIGTLDQPRTRFWIRRGTNLIAFAFLAATITGIVGASTFERVVKGEIDAHQNMVVRYASSAVALFLTLWIIGASLWGYFFLPRVNKRGCTIICAIASLMCVIAIYRLSVMHNMTDSLRSMAPGSLTSRADKATFYIFHVLPEWLSIGLLFIFNTRREFSTGFIGDWRWRDETPKELESRLKKEAIHREKLKLRKLETPERVLLK